MPTGACVYSVDDIFKMFHKMENAASAAASRICECAGDAAAICAEPKRASCTRLMVLPLRYSFINHNRRILRGAF
jgi:hypothetical protein